MDGNRQELLEIYKLHAELADLVSQRREGANRLYVSLLTGIVLVLATFLRYGSEIVHVETVLTAFCIFGILLSASWFVIIRSYRQLNTGKFDVLHELEQKLAYPFFKREWQLLEEGKNLSRYWKLTIVETFLPWIFVFLFSALIIFFFTLCG